MQGEVSDGQSRTTGSGGSLSVTLEKSDWFKGQSNSVITS